MSQSKVEFFTISEFKAKFGITSMELVYNTKTEKFSILCEEEEEFLPLANAVQEELQGFENSEDAFDHFFTISSKLRFWTPCNAKGKAEWTKSSLIIPKEGSGSPLLKRSI